MLKKDIDEESEQVVEEFLHQEDMCMDESSEFVAMAQKFGVKKTTFEDKNYKYLIVKRAVELADEKTVSDDKKILRFLRKKGNNIHNLREWVCSNESGDNVSLIFLPRIDFQVFLHIIVIDSLYGGGQVKV